MPDKHGHVLFRCVIIPIIIPPLCCHRNYIVQLRCAFVFTCTRICGFYSPVMALTGSAEEFSEGTTIQLLSDRLSFSARCGSTKSSHRPHNVPFFLFTLLSVPCFSIPSYLVPVHCIEGIFFIPCPFYLTSFLLSINQSLDCNAKILITGVLRCRYAAESQLEQPLFLRDPGLLLHITFMAFYLLLKNEQHILLQVFIYCNLQKRWSQITVNSAYAGLDFKWDLIPTLTVIIS